MDTSAAGDEHAGVFDSLFESYAEACRNGADVDDGADAAFEASSGKAGVLRPVPALPAYLPCLPASLPSCPPARTHCLSAHPVLAAASECMAEPCMRALNRTLPSPKLPSLHARHPQRPLPHLGPQPTPPSSCCATPCCPGPRPPALPPLQEGVERVREHLLSSTGEAAACMICLESIRPQDPVWSCQDSCYAVMHLPCIQVGSGRGAGGRAGLHRAAAMQPCTLPCIQWAVSRRAGGVAGWRAVGCRGRRVVRRAGRLQKPSWQRAFFCTGHDWGEPFRYLAC